MTFRFRIVSEHKIKNSDIQGVRFGLYHWNLVLTFLLFVARSAFRAKVVRKHRYFAVSYTRVGPILFHFHFSVAGHSSPLKCCYVGV